MRHERSPARFRRARFAIACVAALALMPRPASPADAPLSDPSCGEIVLVTRPDAPVIALPHGFVRAGSDSVWSARGPWRAGVDYSLERVRGELRLLREIVPGESLHVRTCWLLDPPPLELQRDHYRPAAAAAESASRAVPETAPRPVTAHAAAPPPGASLALTGNKTLAVEFGSSQDAVLRQSLDLALSGSVAPGVQLTGVLTDRNTPITAAGSTLELQSVDQVRLELAAPQGGATLGDLSLRFDDGEFARLERRLQGVRGEWSAAGVHLVASFASAAGEYNRLQFFGVDGQQGPYPLTDRDGGVGVSVVAGSEIVTLDGQRLVRGGSADYSMDYEGARLSFTNRRLITSASRITVDYQYALRRFKRNFSGASARWDHGAVHGYTRVLTEGDDRGSPLGAVLDAGDRLALAAAGDSANRAIGLGVTVGGGDYDTVRVATRLTYAFAGPDSGQFSVQFALVGTGRGDYADSAVVAGRTVYRYVGVGLGRFVVGRALPFAESHTLWAAGTGVRMGALALEAEGALSHHDFNTFSTLDDGADAGFAGRLKARLEGHPALLPGRAALELEGRDVDRRFAPFTRLEMPFEAEHWGLPPAADFEHAKRLGAAGEWWPRAGGDLRAEGGEAFTPDGYSAKRAAVVWSGAGAFLTHAQWERSAAERAGWAYPNGGRDRAYADARWALRWVSPLVRFERDQRRFPSDTGQVGDGFVAGGAELASGSAVSWRALTGVDVRRDAREEATGFVDQSEARTLRFSLDSPGGGNLGASLIAQRRDVRPLANPTRTRSDLASARLRAERPRFGLKGELDLEIGSEGENRRDRSVVFVGSGQGAYDQYGNFVGVGDYNLVLSVSSTLERLARAATHARASWVFGSGEAWRGSRAEFTYESGAWRPGDLKPTDPFIAPGALISDPGLERGSVLQRLESDFAPQSRAAAIRLRLERRANADRSFDQFAQTTDQRELSARWRARPGPRVSAEIELTARRQAADQQAIATAFHRVLEGREASAQLILTPDARLRLVGAADVNWTRPEGQIDATRIIQVGPDLGVTVGHKGHGEISARRAFQSGPPAVALIPTADPAGAPRWQGTSRFDYRLLESFTLGISATAREFEGRSPLYTGRAEMRAFF